MTTVNQAYGGYIACTVTNLQSLAIDTTDPYAGWQSDRISNLSTPAVNFQIAVSLTTAATAPANDKAAYIYIVPWIWNASGSAWICGGNFSTTTLPTGTEGTASITDPNSMLGPIAVPYIITSQLIQKNFMLSDLCGGTMPDAFSIVIRNNCGAAFSTGCTVGYKTITFTNA